jgi:phosphoglycolate phosphatase-like HAD superfamily hydrolase
MPKPGSCIRAVIFDFDGTLADSFEAIACSVNYVRGQFGLAPLSVDEVRQHVGRGALHLLRQTVPGVEPASVLEKYRQHHERVMFALTRLMPGAEETIARLVQSNIRLAVCSNKPVDFTRQLLEHFLPHDSVAVVLGPEEVPATETSSGYAAGSASPTECFSGAGSVCWRYGRRYSSSPTGGHSRPGGADRSPKC